MLHRRIIFLSLTFLALHWLQVSTLPLFEGHSLRKDPVINAIATSSGVIDLKKESNSSTTFYVEADLSNQSTSQEKDTSDTVKMVISLVNDQTMVAENCLGLSKYNCSKYNCQKQNSNDRIYYPWFSAGDTVTTKTKIYLDYKHWSLSSSPLYIATSCSTRDNLNDGFASGFSGVLGFGTGSGSIDKFTMGPIFSIFINSDLSAGKLLFKKDTTNYAQSSSPLISLSSGENWQFSASGLTIGSQTLNVYNYMFDMNSDAIGIPQSTYWKLIDNFKSQNSDVWCNESKYKPYCYTRREFKDLTKIFIKAPTGKAIEIPPEIYITLDKETGVYKYFYLNFKATNPNYSGVNYVDSSFESVVILDARFMSYYYTVFDGLGIGEKNKIYLYPSINAPVRPGSGFFVPGVIVGVGILLLSVCIYCRKKRRGVEGDEKKASLAAEEFYTSYSESQNQGVTYTPTPHTPHGVNKKIYQQEKSHGIYQAY